MAFYLSGNNYIDGLLAGTSMTGSIGSGATFTYGFAKDSDPFAIDSKFEKAVGIAAGTWSQFANVHFTKITPPVTGATPNRDVLFQISDATNEIGGTTKNVSGGDMHQGQYSFLTALRGIGSALGLKDRTNFSPLNHDDLDHSIMSTKDGTYAKAHSGLAPITPLPDDIAAAQYLYGANMSTNAGDTRYKINAGDQLHTIWDAGGHDIIDTTSYNAGAVIDLRDTLPNNDTATDTVAGSDPSHPYFSGIRPYGLLMALILKMRLQVLVTIPSQVMNSIIS